MGERWAAPVSTVVLSLGAIGAAVTVASLLFLGGSQPARFHGVPRAVYAMGVDADIACSTTQPDGNPGGCSTPLPSLESAALASAKPLEIPALDIPITATGHLEVYLGDVTLANGVLRAAEFRVDGIEPGLQSLPPGLETSGTVHLEVRPTDPTRPHFGNIYTRGWHSGTEVAKVYLVMDVTRFDPGTVFPLRDVEVK